jgi:FtsP/CotA-like multicopper oxidase with cupredoxin domain
LGALGAVHQQGVREAVKLQFRKMRTGAPEVARLSAAQQGDWMAQNCPGEPLPQFGVANDGLTRAQMAQQTVAVLQPGQPVAGDLKAYIQARLLEAADRTMPISVRQAVRDDLANDLSLRLFAAHRNVEDAEVTGRQSLEFKIGGGFQVDGKPYDPTRIDRVLPLGGVEEWTLTSFTNPPVGHPFHIHVNAFQIKKILNRQGEDVVNGEPNDPLYAGLKDVWKDTIFVKPGYRVVMRTRYQRYIGDFVLHCHILDHEDQGMMQNIRIAIPDGAGGVTTGHH